MAPRHPAAKRRRPRTVPSRFDPFLDDSTLRETYQLLLAGDWDAFDETLENDRQPWVIQSILTSDDAAIETIVFERLYEAIPSARSLSVLGGAQVRDTWNLLEVIEPNLIDQAFTGLDIPFQDRMAAADATLHKAVLLRPALPDPWVHLLNTGRGLSIDLQELRTRLPMAHLEYGLADASDLTLTEHLILDETVAELTPALAAFLLATPTDARPAELPVLNAFALAMTAKNAETATLTEECSVESTTGPPPTRGRCTRRSRSPTCSPRCNEPSSAVHSASNDSASNDSASNDSASLMGATNSSVSVAVERAVLE